MHHDFLLDFKLPLEMRVTHHSPLLLHKLRQEPNTTLKVLIVLWQYTQLAHLVLSKHPDWAD